MAWHVCHSPTPAWSLFLIIPLRHIFLYPRAYILISPHYSSPALPRFCSRCFICPAFPYTFPVGKLLHTLQNPVHFYPPCPANYSAGRRLDCYFLGSIIPRVPNGALSIVQCLVTLLNTHLSPKDWKVLSGTFAALCLKKALSRCLPKAKAHLGSPWPLVRRLRRTDLEKNCHGNSVR